MRSLFVLGVVIHLALLYSIFDIYFSSPIIYGLPAHEIAQSGAPAKRVIFFSADGLRYDTFVNNPDKSPFLHGIIRNNQGVSGVSTSHMPTESRPGHVALFAGFTEDVSAVTAGWKKNPVPFDSIFNRSGESWLIGSPDIVELFPAAHINIQSYSASEEDFSSNEAHKLDEWVFQRFEKLLHEADRDAMLDQRLRAEKRMFFLHLLGLDTNGHGHKPASSEYINNIAVVDAGIDRVTKLASEFFGDDGTAFILTADHGMTDWGSHGAGSDAEVLTPFVAWGAGVKSSGARINISQVDVAVLLSSLLGVPIPVNSAGILPKDVLAASEEYIFRANYANFQQLREQMMHLRAEKERRLWFTEYSKFGTRALESLTEQLRALSRNRRFNAATTMWTEHAQLLRDAIFHYHRYDRGFFGLCISASFLLWVALVISVVTRPVPTNIYSKAMLTPPPGFIALYVLVMLLCLYCRFTITCSVYVLMPIFLATLLRNVYRNAASPYSKPVSDPAQKIRRFLPLIVLLGFSILPFVSVFSDRRALSLVFFLLNLVPYAYGKIERYDSKLMWHLVCSALCVFPFLSTVGRDQHPWLCISAPIVMGVIYRIAAEHHFFAANNDIIRKAASANFFAALLIFITEYTPLLIRAICWMTLPAAFILPILWSRRKIVDRLAAFLGFLFVPYSLLSIAYESVFVLFFVALLILLLRFEFANFSDTVLLQLEAATRKTSGLFDELSVRDVVRTWTVVALVLGALFGTGNFASLNSFNPSTLHRFISVFSPFTMAMLLVFKLIIPLLMLTMVFSAILLFDIDAINRLSYLTLAITDVIAMCLFYQLKDTGSWLDIGLSISAQLMSNNPPEDINGDDSLLDWEAETSSFLNDPEAGVTFDERVRKIGRAPTDEDDETLETLRNEPGPSRQPGLKKISTAVALNNVGTDQTSRAIVEEFLDSISSEQRELVKSNITTLFAELLARGRTVPRDRLRNFLQRVFRDLSVNGDRLYFGSGVKINQDASRYNEDFVEVNQLGKGGFGQVKHVLSRLDQCHYAVKKIRLNQNCPAPKKVLAEVMTMARLDHPNVVRYHTAWMEADSQSTPPGRRRRLSSRCGPKVVELLSSDEEDEDDAQPENNLPSISGHNEIDREEEGSSYNPSFGDTSSAIRTPAPMGRFFAAGDSSTDSSSEESIPDEKQEQTTQKSSSGSETPTAFTSGSVSMREVMELRAPERLSKMAKFVDMSQQTLPTTGLNIFIQMELCEQTLTEYLQERNAAMHTNMLSEENAKETLRFSIDLMSAVEYLHANLVIHRDIKPANIFLTQKPDCKRLKLGDFGLATHEPREDVFVPIQLDRKMSMGVGTALYAAPEQVRSSDYGNTVDIFSCGIVLCELFGCFQTNMERVGTLEAARQGRIPLYLLNYSPDLYNTVVTMLFTELPEARPSAAEVLRHLGGIDEEVCHPESQAACIRRLREEVCDLRQLVDALQAVRGVSMMAMKGSWESPF
ncbi:unnamed protein product, partial [Mesorhabditis spiculigera]